MKIVKFGVTKPVPVNLLTASILLAGVFFGLTLTREFFPDSTPDMASIPIVYPGASPQQVQEGIAIKIEDAVIDLKEVKQVTSTLVEGGGRIMVEFHDNVEIGKAVDEVERAINRLTDLPPEAERLTVSEFEPQLQVIILAVYGDVEERLLKQTAMRVRDELKLLPDMGEIRVTGTREYEIRVDVDQQAVLKHGLSLPQIADVIGAWMRDIPGGAMRTATGNISIRTMPTKETIESIREIVLRSSVGGDTLRLGDIAEIVDDFVDTQLVNRFNGMPAANLMIFKTGDQDAVEIAEMVRAYVAALQGKPLEARNMDRLLKPKIFQAYELGMQSADRLPAGIEVGTHSDLARFIEGRLDLLIRNAFAGATLVFLTLLIFLNWRVALWVGMGLVIAICGTLVLMSWSNITLNLLTMFGLIVVLGLLVDDAIVVGENIQARHDRGEPALLAAINGTTQVFWPVVATIATSVVAFMPLLLIKGQIGNMIGALPLVVTCALIMSLLESILILPSHIGHTLRKRDLKQPGRVGRLVGRYEAARDGLIQKKIAPAFGRLLDLSLRFRYVSVAIALATLIVSVAMLASGRVTYTFLTDSDSEIILVDIRMPIGTPFAETTDIVQRFEAAAAEQPEVISISTSIGASSDMDSGTFNTATNIAQVFMELAAVELREARNQRESRDVIDGIRQAVGPVPEADLVRFSEISGGPGGPDITLRVLGEDVDAIMVVVDAIKRELMRFPGVQDISDDNFAGQRELRFEPTPSGAALGFTQAQIARQVRGAVAGIDAYTFADRREDIDVRVRFDEASRRHLQSIESMWVISPTGQRVPLAEIATTGEGTAFTTIRRIDRRRAITVSADTDPATNPEDVVRALPIEDLRRAHPGVIIDLAGRQQQQAEAFASLPIGFLAAIIMIYVILAWLFSSYTQPIAVMLAIPFGIIGVIWGHWLLGYEVTFLSMIGFVALSGIVVNDSLILVEFYNHLREEGMNVRDALVEAGQRRLRPIFLTTVTTVLGLTPLMLEQSFQAKFLIPMAISIAFGLMSATVLILMVLPCIVTIVEDIKSACYFLWHGRPRPEAPQKMDPGLMSLPD